MFTWGEELEDTGNDVNDAAAEAAQAVLASNVQVLEDAIDQMDDLISTLFDTAASPSLDPVTAGSIDASYDPSSLQEYADACMDLASGALQELKLHADADHDMVGTQLKTLQHLLNRSAPHSYRSIAGL